jgi:hypothetical protein
MPGRLPRATGNSPVVIDPLVWNDVCDRLERVENLTVTDPLQCVSGGSGIRLSLKRIKCFAKPLKITGNRTGGGEYQVDVGRWQNGPLSTSSGYDLTTATDFADAYEATLVNSAESGFTTHRIGNDTIVPAWFTETPTATLMALMAPASYT